MFRAVQTFFKGGQIRLPTSKYGVTKILLYIYNIIYSEFHFHGITAAWYNLTAVVVTCKINLYFHVTFLGQITLTTLIKDFQELMKVCPCLVVGSIATY